jgi:YD repeat-containing protein
MLVPAYGDYTPRAKVSEAILAAGSIRMQVTEFYDEHRRLPTLHEASRFRTERPSRWVETIGYDAAGKRIEVTLREIFPGKRFALQAHEGDGQLTWTCRTIDLEKKHLPASCRG